MADLLKKPIGTHGKVHDITPSSAGWNHVGFGLYHLKAGDRANEVTADREVIVVMVEGKARITGAGQDWGILGDRMSVFEKHRRIACICPTEPSGRPWRKPTALWPSVRRRVRAVIRRVGLDLMA